MSDKDEDFIEKPKTTTTKRKRKVPVTSIRVNHNLSDNSDDDLSYSRRSIIMKNKRRPSTSSSSNSAFYPSSTNKIKQQIRSDENYVPFYPSPFYQNTFQTSFSPYSTPTSTNVYATNDSKIHANNPYWTRHSFYNTSNHYSFSSFDPNNIMSSTPPQTVPHESLNNTSTIDNLSSYFTYNPTNGMNKLSTLHNDCSTNFDFYS